MSASCWDWRGISVWRVRWALRCTRHARSIAARQAGAAVPRLHLPDSKVVESQPSGGGQGGVSVEGENPRFVVTNLSSRKAAAKRLYEQLYCARGEMENRIKEQQLDLFADRTSAHTMRANQLRLYLSSFAYVLMHALRRLGTEGTQFARAQCATLRLKLLKIGARVKITARRVWLSFSQAYPYAKAFTEVLANLQKEPVWNPSG